VGATPKPILRAREPVPAPTRRQAGDPALSSGRPISPGFPLAAQRDSRMRLRGITRLPPGVTITSRIWVESDPTGSLGSRRPRPRRPVSARWRLHRWLASYPSRDRGSVRDRRRRPGHLPTIAWRRSTLIRPPWTDAPPPISDCWTPDSIRVSVVVAGDSAGAGHPWRWRGACAMRRPLPAGFALVDGWFDLTCSGHSMETNRRRDVGLARAHLVRAPSSTAAPPI